MHHLLVYHCLDVAAVGWALLRRHRKLCRHLAELLRFDEGALARWLPMLLAIHDVGKFSPGFQKKDLDLYQSVYGGPWPPVIRDEHHTICGRLLWEERLREHALPLLGFDADEDVPDLFADAVIGHHGEPAGDAGLAVLSELFPGDDVVAVEAFIRDAAETILGGEAPVVPTAEAFRRTLPMASWALAGFAVLCDWLGSDQGIFEYQDRHMALTEYWRQIALPRAHDAISNSGVVPPPPSGERSFMALFDHEQPTPLQALTGTTPIDEGPQLFILEELTGSGKTEAALTLVHRLMSAGHVDGFYVALPTMATADAMYHRVGETYRKLYADSTRPSLVLAHSSRDLSEDFRSSIGPEDSPLDRDYASDEATATTTCTAWLADNRKKALLAQVGVGTIDQALLAILHARHQSLRVLGLQRKVLVVDEVHACDAYQNRLLEILLRLHAACGGSAVLLTATLPSGTRNRLVHVFAEGAGIDPPALERVDFPLLTHVCLSGSTEQRVKARRECVRTLSIRLTDSESEAESALIEAAREGHCACWIRNTVADAAEAASRLSEVLGSDRVTLFHARFALVDRLTIEGDVCHRFGPNSGHDDRTGHVLVATQVVEQSLDLDFDVMVSDLAPLDLLLQRAGRLRRHSRGRNGNRCEPPDLRGDPELLVVSPAPDDDADRNWISAPHPGTAAVYRNHAHLWLTARTIADTGTFRLPEQARDMIESVYGSEAELRLPAGLEPRLFDAEADDACARSLGSYRVVDLASGYQADTGRWDKREEVLTRLGEPTVTLRLARWDGNTLTPWAANFPHPWRHSEVSVRRSVIDREAEPDEPALAAAAAEVKLEWPSKGKWHVLIPLVQAGAHWHGKAMRPGDHPVTVVYSTRRGMEAQ